VANKKSEALHDRMIMVRIPYNLQVSQEERIYQKLLRATSLAGVHMAPHRLFR
jgi:serine protein kinase